MEISDNPVQRDVVVIGGALSGAATAMLLRRRNKKLRITIVEKSDRFKRRVGESTVEVSSYFLGRVLGLTEHLNTHHFVKQGLRFWFANGETEQLFDCSETGPGYNVRFPGYQVDRAVLDEEVLARAVASGIELIRPARVSGIELTDGGQQTVSWRDDSGETGCLKARWVVDASGIASVIGRKLGLISTNSDHPITSCWARWRGVKNWDSRELRERDPKWADRAKAIRFTATNHLMGHGWWAWWIPLKNGDVSIGVVYDQRLVELPAGESLGARLSAFLKRHPVGREMLKNATFVDGDVHFRRDCAYRASALAGNGWALVGDAAGFIDPFYSPGMDWITFTACSTAALIDQCSRGRRASERVARHNRRFAQCYTRWFESIYRDKYFYIGDHELMTLAFRLDLGLYYLGIVSQPFRFGEQALETPAFTHRGAGFAAALIRLYHRRLAAMGYSRVKRGVWGRKNAHRFVAFTSYELDFRLPLRILGSLSTWLRLEFTEGWRTWFRRPVFGVDERHANMLKTVATPAGSQT